MSAQQASVSTSALNGAAMPASLGAHALLYLLVAALCLIFALRFMRTALAPIGPLLQAVAAAALVALAIGAALVFLTAAAFSGR
jgi:hypothetical protein